MQGTRPVTVLSVRPECSPRTLPGYGRRPGFESPDVPVAPQNTKESEVSAPPAQVAPVSFVVSSFHFQEVSGRHNWIKILRWILYLLSENAASRALFRRPQAVAADEGISVCTQTSFRRQCLDFLYISASQHDVVGVQCGFEFLHDSSNVPAPFLFSHALKTSQSQVIFVCFSLLVREMCQFHRFDDAIHNHG